MTVAEVRPRPSPRPSQRSRPSPRPRPLPYRRPAHRLSRPLAPARTAAVATLIAATVVFVVMAVWLHARMSETGVDTRLRNSLFAHAGDTMARALLTLSEPALTIGVIALVGVIAIFRRRWSIVALCAVGPLLGLVLEAYVLKPLIGRRLVVYIGTFRFPPPGAEQGFAFPSGHQTGLTCVTALLAILLLRARLRPGVKIAGMSALAVWTLLGALGLVRNLYHYATDTVGGILLGIAVMTVTALVIDSLSPRVAPLFAAKLSSLGAPARTRTVHAA